MHREINLSAGVRTTAIITSRGCSLISHYRAGSLMKTQSLVTCRRPAYAHKRPTLEKYSCSRKAYISQHVKPDAAIQLTSGQTITWRPNHYHELICKKAGKQYNVIILALIFNC